jgi:hypothetical protein
VAWVRSKRLATPNAYPPIIYANRATLTPLFNAMNKAGLHIVHDFRLWIATLDGTKTVKDMTGVTAVQHAGEKITGHHYDESIVYDGAWLRPPPPPVPPAPPIPVEHGYLVMASSLGGFLGRAVQSADGGKSWR